MSPFQTVSLCRSTDKDLRKPWHLTYLPVLFNIRNDQRYATPNVWELSERPMQATTAPRSENDQRPPSLETAPAVRLSDLGWTACLCLLNCTTLRAAALKGQHWLGPPCWKA